MAETMIKATGLSCKSGYKYLLKDINWEVKKGEHWVVFGMNGSGKTTLLSIISGFKQPTSGSLEVFGQPYSQANILALRKRIGWVSSSFFDRFYTQEAALDIVLSGKFGTMSLDFDITSRDIRRAKKLLSELHLADKMNQPFHTMSKGERQNVLIARALLFEPEILVLDEPCTGLDVMARAHLLKTVADLAEHTEVTIIYVTHYTEEIMGIFNQALLLKQGHVYAQGETSVLFTQRQMSDFLGYPVQICSQKGQAMQLTVDVGSQVRNLLEGYE